MFILYDLAILIFSLVYLPVYLFKRKFHPGFLMRFGVLPADLKLNSPVWIHAVSVGEAMAVKNLVKGLKAIFADKQFFISTVTPTGNKIARGIAGRDDFVAYFPLDFSFIAKSFVDKVKPSLFIITETEIWPNLISCLHKRNIPVILVNARISDRSFRGYLCAKFLLKSVLNKITLFCCQTKADEERLLRLGAAREKIRVTGNMKFDAADYSDKKIADSANRYRQILELKEDEKLWVCGSTHPQEEEIILDVYKRLIRGFPQLKLLIAPRHPERAGSIQNLVSEAGFRGVLVSDLPQKPCACISRPVFILDVIGELIYFYNIADIVFVGGSLVRKGGHNILEPASLGKPVISGPHMFNFRDIAGLFLENKALLLAHNQEELWQITENLLKEPDGACALTRAAKSVILQNQGATARNIDCIKGIFNFDKKGG